MNILLVMLADVDEADIMNAQQHFMDSRFYEVAVTFGSIILAILVAVVWAIYYSLKIKKRKHRHKHHHQRDGEKRSHAPFANIPAPAQSSPESSDDEGRKKRRRMRRSHRPMNPTLAQTRGLPPLRDENTPLPPMP